MLLCNNIIIQLNTDVENEEFCFRRWAEEEERRTVVEFD